MGLTIADGRKLTFLLELVRPDQARRVLGRLGQLGSERTAPGELRLLLNSRQPPPLNVWLWVLACDLPELNAVAFDVRELGDAIRRDIIEGVPFGPERDRRTERLPLGSTLQRRQSYGQLEEEFDLPARQSAEQLLPALRAAGEARRLRRARMLAGALPRDQWDEVARADRADPLPGYARWALSCQVNCPPSLRAQFGSHAKFRYRVEQAGLLAEPHGYLGRTCARDVLLTLGVFAQPHYPAGRQFRDELAPLVREHLGGHADAWAVLAQLLPTFNGSLSELISTAGAIAGPDPDPELDAEPEPDPDEVGVGAGADVGDGGRPDSNRRIPDPQSGAAASALQPPPAPTLAAGGAVGP